MSDLQVSPGRQQAAGRIKSTYAAPVSAYLMWSVLALAITAPALFSIPKEWHKGNPAILVVLLFPAVALYLLIYSLVLWRSSRRFGDCFFEMTQTPAPLGGALEGMIQTGKRLNLEHDLHLTLSCIRRERSNSNSGRREFTVWQSEKIYGTDADLPESEPGHTGIPVYFKLPADQPEGGRLAGDTCFWRLEAKSEMSGLDFRAAFVVPVFRPGGAIAAISTDGPDPTAALQAPIDEIRRDEHSKIQITDGPDGREFYFPAARNLNLAISSTVWCLAFGGACAAMVVFHASVFFEIGFSVVTVPLGWYAFSLWFKSSRVTIDSGGVLRVTRWLFLTRRRKYAAADINCFTSCIAVTNGSRVLQAIQLELRPGTKAFLLNPTMAGGIPTAEAQWLVKEMTRALGRPESS